MPRLTSIRAGVRRASRTYAGPLAILAVGWLLAVIYAYPGQMTQDSYDHLLEARAGIYTDGHPPLIPAVWRIVDLVIAGPLGMLVIQLTAFQAGLYLAFRRTFARRGAAIAATALLVFPPVLLPMTVIWKDCLMAGGLLLGLGCLLDRRRGVRLAGLGALMLATGFRYNALAATLPLVVVLFEWRPGLPWLRRYAIALGAWFALTFVAFGINAALTDKQMHVWHSSLAVYDIVGTLAYVDDLSDAELEQLLAGTELKVHHDIHATMRALFSPRDFQPIINDPNHALWSLPIFGQTPAPAPQRAALSRAWWEVLSSHPIAYLEYRFAVIAEVLCLGDTSRPSGAITRRYIKYPDIARGLGLQTEWPAWQHDATRVMRMLWKHTPMFVPWIYLLLALVMLPLTRRHRDLFAVLASGIVMEGSLLVLAPSPDYRYSHWMVVCTAIGVISVTARRYRDARAAAGHAD